MTGTQPARAAEQSDAGDCHCRALLERAADAVDLALDMDPIEATALLAEIRDELDEALGA